MDFFATKRGYWSQLFDKAWWFIWRNMTQIMTSDLTCIFWPIKYSLRNKNSEIPKCFRILTYFRWIHTCPKKLFGVFNQSLPLVWRWTWCSWISWFFWWNILFWSCSFRYVVSWRFQKMGGNSWWTVKRW